MKSHNLPVILGSQSTGRQEVLREMGYEFVVTPANIDEKTIRDKNPEKLVIKLARAKAEVLIRKIKKQGLIITADQVVVVNGEMREKPIDENQARRYVQDLSRYPVHCINGIVVVNTESGKRLEAVDISTIYFDPIPAKVIEDFLATGVAYKCAGGFRVRDPLLKPYVHKIEGSIESIMGLPIALTEGLIKQIN